MQKEFNVINLLSKLSSSSFFIETGESRYLITPGVYLGMPSKFFRYEDILDTVMKNLYVNGKGEVVVSLQDLQNNLKPTDLNQYFTELENGLKNKDILGINNENSDSETKAEKLTQQTTQNDDSEKEEKQTQQPEKQNYTKRTYNNGYNKGYYGYGSTSTNGYKKTTNGYKKSYTNSKGSYKKTYKKSGNR